MEELTPLLQDCFKLGQHERPQMRQANVMVTLNVVADRGRGVIKQSSVDESDTELAPEFAECIRETMYQLDLVAPVGDHSAILYPLKFVSSGDQPQEMLEGASER